MAASAGGMFATLALAPLRAVGNGIVCKRPSRLREADGTSVAGVPSWGSAFPAGPCKRTTLCVVVRLLETAAPSEAVVAAACACSAGCCATTGAGTNRPAKTKVAAGVLTMGPAASDVLSGFSSGACASSSIVDTASGVPVVSPPSGAASAGDAVEMRFSSASNGVPVCAVTTAAFASPAQPGADVKSGSANFATSGEGVSIL
ncbi:hypothetical protein Ga0100231_006345 [Opitutaceae bacterium TAV4]|nr:hypothetical protein Ga0100231_006345 [Opitutaceae bacterium TAV4]